MMYGHSFLAFAVTYRSLVEKTPVVGITHAQKLQSLASLQACKTSSIDFFFFYIGTGCQQHLD